MLYQTLNFALENHELMIESFIHEDKSVIRDSVLIFPGGGYEMVCHHREGGPVAKAYFEHGLNAFVLDYKVGSDCRYPSHLIDASFAIVYLKEHASELGIDPNRIFAVGFSAGGHLAGSLAILHKDREVLSKLGIKEGDNRPCGAVLSYPVVSAECLTHNRSFEMLTGKSFSDISAEERHKLSLECNVDADSAPLFIWHTSRDTVVPMLGSLRLAEAYYKLERPVSLRIYPYGDHGAALANEITASGNPDYIQPLAEEWVEASVKWMQTVK